MSDPLSASQNAGFSESVNANSPAQFNLSFPPPIPNNVNYNQNNNTNGAGTMAMPPGVSPQMFFQNDNGNGNGNFSQASMNHQSQAQGMPQSGSPVNGSQFDPAALQARIALAQQMAQHGMQQHNQQEQKVNGAGGQGQAQGPGHERRASGSGTGTGAVPTGDWAQLSNAANAANAGAGGGMMPNAQATTREALMKQLQALQSSHAAATRNRLGSGSGIGQSPPAPSPGTNVSQPSPIPQQSPLHADSQMGQSPMSAVNPSLRGQSFDGGQARPGSSGSLSSNHPPPFQQPNPPTPASSTAPGPPMRSISGSQPPQTGSPAGNNPSTSNNINTPIRPPGVLPPGARQPLALAEQRRQFLQSLVNWHKSNNIPPPPEIFNSERTGAIKMGDVWVEVVELFLTVLRIGGIDRVTKLPPESPFWQAFFKTKGIPNPLPTPITLPHKSTDQPGETTTDPVRFLIRAYMVWLYGFELHMNNSKMALAQRQQQNKMAGSQKSAPSPAQSQAPVDLAPTPQGSGPSPAPTTAPTPVGQSAPTPTMGSAPTPTGYAPTPQSQNQNYPYPAPTPPNNAFPPQMGYPPHQAMPPQMGQMGQQMPSQGFAPPYPLNSSSGPSADNTRHVPPPIQTDSHVPMSGSHTSTPTPARGTGAKRGRKRKDANGTAASTGGRSAGTSRAATPAATPAPAPAPAPPAVETPVERPPTPKRARYKVEYRPLHLPQKHLAGWDDRAVSSTFPKNNIGHPARSIHELGIVDMESVLMGLRSRLPRELGYCLTVLSMLSMGSPEENIPGLPLTAITEIYIELLELLSEAAFGEDGYEAWSATAPTKSSLNEMSFGELEQIGRDFDFGLDERKDSTGGQTDIVLTCLNLLRNLSILPENCQLMSSHPEVFELLANLSDGRLCRLPASSCPTTDNDDDGDAGSSSSKPKQYHQPFSIYELARVRRDVITILSNLGSSIELSRSTPSSIEQVVKVVSSFLSSGWSGQTTKESLYGAPLPPPPHQPASAVASHSINRAVEAFCKLSWSDANREVLSKLPESQLVGIFESMLKLLPVQRRHFELLYSTEEYLGQIECLALSLYSLAFLSPLSTRTRLRNIPGGISVMVRIIFDLSRKGIDFRSNPYAVLVRRLAETLGILNGTNGLESEDSLDGMSFGANLLTMTGAGTGGSGDGAGGGGGGGSGNKVVQRGWLAEHEERVMESMGIRGIDVPAFVELDNLWWAGD